MAAFGVGTTVYTAYGAGVVKSYRESDAMHAVELSNWRLAQGQSPTLFARADSLSDKELPPSSSSSASSASHEHAEESAAKYVQKTVAVAVALKDEAGALFRAKDFNGAKTKYLEALDAMKYLGEGLTNEQKALVFELTVPCHNNLALCSMQVQEYSEAAIYARNGITLVSAIEERIDNGKVWQQLVSRGMTLKKLRNEWKKKSHFLAGKADLMRREYDTAVTNLEEALRLTLHDDPTAAAEEAKLRELLQVATKKRAAELKKEKSTWTRAFEKNSALDAGAAPTSSSAPPSPARNGGDAEPTIDLTKPGRYGDVFDAAASAEAAEAAEEAARRRAQDETLGWVVGVGLVVATVAAASVYLFRSRK
jgi:tetratricopeptide (TPR) repeat protein